MMSVVFTCRYIQVGLQRLQPRTEMLLGGLLHLNLLLRALLRLRLLRNFQAMVR
jgi:hypothetical protein